MGKFSGLSRHHVLDWLVDNVPESRIAHILRVEQMAIALASEHALDIDKAAQAGLMHDLAKCFNSKTLLEMAHQEGLELDPVDHANPHLLHADASAIVARDVFQVHDQDVLDAIATHTLGEPGMSALSCVVYLADSLEPGRGDTAELNRLRQMSWQNLQVAVWMTCDYTLKSLMDARRLIHPRAVSTRNWFMQQAAVYSPEKAGGGTTRNPNQFTESYS
jgi:predicted HD superfamily hydrolase involved in NAD metabolism